MSAYDKPLPPMSSTIFPRRQEYDEQFMAQHGRVSPEIMPEQQPFHTPYKVHMVPQTSSRDESTEYKGSYSYDEPTFMPVKKPSLRSRYPLLFDMLQGVIIFVVVGALLVIPVAVTSDARESRDGDNDARQKKNLIYYIFLVLLTTWGMTGIFYLIAVALPYIFYAVAHFINPAHKKYWRVFIMMRRPITFLFAVISGYIALTIWFWENDQISGFNNAKGDTEEEQQVSQQEYAVTVATTAKILLYFILWAGAYFLEKIMMAYLTIHYHYRANHKDVQRGKKIVEVLSELLEYSTWLYPQGHTMFAVEDYVIYKSRDSSGAHDAGSSTAAVLDKVSGNFVQAFGIVFGSDSKTHWLAPRSTYATVTRALEHPASSAALAKRIWMSFAAEGSMALTQQDLREAFGPNNNKAIEYFRILDENENGDIRLDELVPTVVEAGKKRKEIYTGMCNMAHVINTLDWIAIAWLAIIMLGLCFISEIDLLKQIKEVIGFAALGLSFVAGRTLNEIIQGAIFTILDHPYDIGDVVEIYTLGEGVKVLLTVKRISLLYTVFTEVGSGKQVQYANMRSKIKRISNLTRSGKNREGISIGVDFNTTFTDLQLLKQELQKFVAAPENSRDYYPDVALRVTSLCDLNRLELRVSFLHKSNWSNDALRAARSSRFHCAVVAAVRKVPIAKPGGSGKSLGDEAKPSYTVMITDTEAAAKRTAEADKVASKRMDFEEGEKEELEAKKKVVEEQAQTSVMGLKPVPERRGFGGDFAFVSGIERGVRPVRRA